MAIQPPYDKLTVPRLRVLALLSDGKTIRQVTDVLGCTYNGARSQVRDLEHILGCSSIDAVREWWVQHAESWLGYVARAAGLVK